MTAVEYWSLLSGYWVLFEDKKVFTALWDAMIKASQEYAVLREHADNSGVMRTTPSIALNWEKITIAETTYAVEVTDDGGVDKGYNIASITSIVEAIGGARYLDTVDYTYDQGAKALTWINAPDPNFGDFIAEEIYIYTDIMESYYNTGLFDLDLSIYDEPQWVLYACVKHLGCLQTEQRLKNIMSILAGAPFSKYYGEFSTGSGYCYINYAVDVTSDHEGFLAKNELEGYCYLDEETGELYDERYPIAGVSVVLCHKNNLQKIDGRYSIILRGEEYAQASAPAYASGELCPTILYGDYAVGGIEPQYADACIPLYGCVANGTFSTDATYDFATYGDMIRGMMYLSYVNNINIAGSNVSIIGASSIKVLDTLAHVFSAGEDIILVDATVPTSTAYCNIISGNYNAAEEAYILNLSATLTTGHSYSIVIPKKHAALLPVTAGGVDGEITIPIIVTDDQMPVLRQGAICTAEDRLYHLASAAGNTLVIEEAGYDIAIGDIVIVTTGGEQDIYEAIGLSAGVQVSPTLRRAYAGGEAIYNAGEAPNIGSLRLYGTDIQGMPDATIIKANIGAYMDVWNPGLMIHYGFDSTYPDKNPEQQVARDDKYWQPLDVNAKKEIKE